MRNLLEEVAGHSPLDPKEAVRQSTRAPQRKRFYDRVTVGELPNGFAILLDGKPIRTPARAMLAVPTRGLATAIAAEWDAQRDTLDPMSMPMTRLANSVVDGVVGREDAVAQDMAKYLESDLVCYRASHPAELVSREAKAWDPVLYWMAQSLNAHFILAEGVVHAKQPEQAVAAARHAVPKAAWPLAACHVITTLTGSALLALALWRGALNAEQVWNAALVDDDWNVEQWGADEEVALRRAARKRDFDAAAQVIVDLRNGNDD